MTTMHVVQKEHFLEIMKRMPQNWHDNYSSSNTIELILGVTESSRLYSDSQAAVWRLLILSVSLLTSTKETFQTFWSEYTVKSHTVKSYGQVFKHTLVSYPSPKG